MPDLFDVPQLNTADLWQRFIHDGPNQPIPFREKLDDFLILRLEDYRHLIKLPTTPFRRQVHELVFVTSGSLTRGCDLNTVIVEPGEVHLLLANQISTIESQSDDVTGFYCHFSMDTIIQLYHKEHMVSELARLSALMRNGSVKLSNKAFLAVKIVFERLMDEYKTKNDLSLIDAYLVTLCYEIRNDVSTNQPVIATKQSKPYELAEQFKRLVLQYISHHPSMVFYADQLGVSPNHLNKCVKQTTGKTASALINDVLLMEAKVLLKHSGHSVSEIAHRLGFDDPSYFGRFFKKSTGLTPQSFREND
ncbi:helix-turn-helix domain-containing protein [Spirosoma montaniterrae]|nr:helix-turn-helix domain-containing protein [Spirosoma montaniterrae]